MGHRLGLFEPSHLLLTSVHPGTHASLLRCEANYFLLATHRAAFCSWSALRPVVAGRRLSTPWSTWRCRTGSWGCWPTGCRYAVVTRVRYTDG